jgi:hypothetical protein
MASEFVAVRRSPGTIPFVMVTCTATTDREVSVRIDALARRESIRRVLIDARVATEEVARALLDAARARDATVLDRIALVVPNDLGATHINMVAVSERLALRAYATIPEAERWLLRPTDPNNPSRVSYADIPIAVPAKKERE